MYIEEFQISHWSKSLSNNVREQYIEEVFIRLRSRPERWIVTIPSSDQWLATIGNHWKTIATNGFGDQKPLENHC